MRFREGDSRHGTFEFYQLGCRCDICIESWNTYNAMQRLRRANKGLPEGDRRHGTLNGYQNYFCRCDQCAEARQVYFAERERVIREAINGRPKRKKKR